MGRMHPRHAPPPPIRSGASAPVIGAIRTVTVLFADLVRSTDTRSRIGDPAADWHWLTIEHALVGAVANADGRVVKTVGDGLVAAFESASTALDAATAALQAIEGEQLRVGIATGDVAVVHHDVLGTPVVVAARLCRAAAPDQILATALVLAAAGTRTDVRTDWGGPLDLKGLPSPVDAISIRWQPTPTDRGLDEAPGAAGRHPATADARVFGETTTGRTTATGEEPRTPTTTHAVPARKVDAARVRGRTEHPTAPGVAR